MFLTQNLLPLEEEDEARFPAEQYGRLAQQLTDQFGGVSSFTRSPAEGRWKQGAETEHDEIVVPASQLPREHDFPLTIDAMNLEHGLRQIQTDRGRLHVDDPLCDSLFTNHAIAP